MLSIRRFGGTLAEAPVVDASSTASRPASPRRPAEPGGRGPGGRPRRSPDAGEQQAAHARAGRHPRLRRPARHRHRHAGGRRRRPLRRTGRRGVKPENPDPYPPGAGRDVRRARHPRAQPVDRHDLDRPRSPTRTSTAASCSSPATVRGAAGELDQAGVRRARPVRAAAGHRGPAPQRHWTNQLALALRRGRGRHPGGPLPVAANLSTTVRVHPLFAHEVTPPFVLHYHNEMDAGRLRLPVAQRRRSTRSSTPQPGPRRGARPRLRGLPAPPLARRALRGWRDRGTSTARWRTSVATGCSARSAGRPSGWPRARPADDRWPQGPFPFFVGCGRSGTTLLRAIFDSHPDLAVPDEVSFVIRLARPHYALRYGWPRRFDAAACADLIVANASFRRWGLPEDVTAAPAEPPARLPRRGPPPVRLLGGRAGASTGTPTRPRCTCCTSRLARMFPEARFVHLIRDGRDVALSYLGVAWGPRRSRRRPSSGGGAWPGRGRPGAGSAPAVTARCATRTSWPSPSGTVRELCAFLDLAWDEPMLRYHERAGEVIAAPVLPGAHQRLRLPPTPGLRDWRTEMAPVDVGGSRPSPARAGGSRLRAGALRPTSPAGSRRRPRLRRSWRSRPPRWVAARTGADRAGERAP